MMFRHPLQILEWPAPNFVDPVKQPPYIYPVNGIFFTCATIALSMRMYQRVVVRRWFGADDVFLVMAWFWALCDNATVFFAYSHYSWNLHMWDARPEYLAPGSKALMAAKMFWLTASASIRMSVLCLLYRLLNHIGLLHYRWALHLATFMVVAIWICYVFVTLFMCVPIAAYFVWPSDGTCLDEGLVDTTLSALNTTSEAVVALLPIPMIMSLDMTRRQRINVSGLLCLGSLVVVAGCVRTYFVWTLFNSDDLTWYSAPHWVCSEIELCIAMICACAPSIFPVFGRFVARHKDRLFKIKQQRESVLLSQTDSTKVSKKQNQAPFSTYSTYWKTYDVEGIGIDGLGYTVTVTAGRTIPRRPSKVSKSSFVEKDMESNSSGIRDSPQPYQPKMWMKSSGRMEIGWGNWGRLRSWKDRIRLPRFKRERSSLPLAITATKRIEVIEEFDNDWRDVPTIEAPRRVSMRRVSPEMVRITPTLAPDTPLTTRAISPYAQIQAPLAMRRISPDMVNGNRTLHAGRGTFYHESDDESLSD